MTVLMFLQFTRANLGLAYVYTNALTHIYVDLQMPHEASVEKCIYILDDENILGIIHDEKGI